MQNIILFASAQTLRKIALIGRSAQHERLLALDAQHMTPKSEILSYFRVQCAMRLTAVIF